MIILYTIYMYNTSPYNYIVSIGLQITKLMACISWFWHKHDRKVKGKWMHAIVIKRCVCITQQMGVGSQGYCTRCIWFWLLLGIEIPYRHLYLSFALSLASAFYSYFHFCNFIANLQSHVFHTFVLLVKIMI